MPPLDFSNINPAPETAPAPDAPRFGASGLPIDTELRAAGVYQGLLDRGMSHATALGLTANSVVESKAMVRGPRSSSGAAGTFQWVGPRLDRYIDMHGHAPDEGDLDENLDYLTLENLTNEAPAWNRVLRAPEHPVSKAMAFRTAWERPGRDPAEVIREEGLVATAARQLMRLFGPGSAQAAEVRRAGAPGGSRALNFDNVAPAAPASKALNFDHVAPAAEGAGADEATWDDGTPTEPAAKPPEPADVTWDQSAPPPPPPPVPMSQDAMGNPIVAPTAPPNAPLPAALGSGPRLVAGQPAAAQPSPSPVQPPPLQAAGPRPGSPVSLALPQQRLLPVPPPLVPEEPEATWGGEPPSPPPPRAPEPNDFTPEGMRGPDPWAPPVPPKPPEMAVPAWAASEIEADGQTVRPPPQSYPSAIYNAAGQAVVTGTGEALAGIGQGLDTRAQTARFMLPRLDQIDKGDRAAAVKGAMNDSERRILGQYIRANPDDRAKIRAEMVLNTPSDPKIPDLEAKSRAAGLLNYLDYRNGIEPPPERLKLAADIQAQLATINKGQPNALTQAGENIIQSGNRTFSVNPENEGIGTGVTRAIAGLVPMVAAGGAGALVGGPPGAVAGTLAVIGGQAFHSMRQDAIKSGATAEEADRAAGLAALGQMGLMGTPIGRAVELFPKLAFPAATITMDLAKHGAEFTGWSVLTTLADNLVKRETYKPDQDLLEGVPEAAGTGFLAGAVMRTPNALRAAAARRLNANIPPPAPIPPGTSPGMNFLGEPIMLNPDGTRTVVRGGVTHTENPFVPTRQFEVVQGPPTAPPPGTPPTVPPAAGATATPAAGTAAAPGGVRFPTSIGAPAHTLDEAGTTPSTPEPQGDLTAQIAAMADPKNPRDAVFIAPGTEVPKKVPPGTMVVTTPQGTLLTTNSDKMREFRIGPVNDALIAKMLGLPETKTDALASGQPVVVQTKDKDGNTVAATVASPAGTPAAEAAIGGQTPAGGKVEVTSPTQAQNERGRKVAQEAFDAAEKAMNDGADRLDAARDAYDRERNAGVASDAVKIEYERAVDAMDALIAAHDAAKERLDELPKEPAVAEPADQPVRRTRDQIADEWEALGDPGMAKAVRNPLAGSTPEQIDFLEKKLAEKKAAALPDQPKPKETFSLEDNNKNSKQWPLFKQVASDDARALATQTEQTAQKIVDDINALGLTVKNTGGSFGNAEGRRLHEELSTLTGAFAHFRNQEVARRQGHARADSIDLERTREGLIHLIRREPEPERQPVDLTPATNLPAKDERAAAAKAHADFYATMEAARVAHANGQMSDADFLAINQQHQKLLHDFDRAQARERVEKTRGALAPVGDAWFPPVYSGETLRSQSGRVMSRVPQFRTDTNNAANYARRTLNNWLLKEARAEAAHTGNTHLSEILSRWDAKNFTQSDRDTANDILFGEHGVGPRNRGELTTPAPAPQPAPTPAPAAEPPPEWRVKNPDVPATVFRGSGREAQASVYNPGGAGLPILGPGHYGAFSEENAKVYGPNVEQRPLDLKNPLVIRSDTEWRALTKEAGWEFPNPYGLPKEQVAKETQALRDLVLAKGHDGVVVYWDDTTQYDVDSQNRPIKNLRNVFDVPQAVDYRTAREEEKPATKPEAAKPEPAPKPEPKPEPTAQQAVDAAEAALNAHHPTMEAAREAHTAGRMSTDDYLAVRRRHDDLMDDYHEARNRRDQELYREEEAKEAAEEAARQALQVRQREYDAARKAHADYAPTLEAARRDHREGKMSDDDFQKVRQRNQDLLRDWSKARERLESRTPTRDAIKELDDRDAPDEEYRDFASSGGREPLKPGETWRDRAVRLANTLEPVEGQGAMNFDHIAPVAAPPGAGPRPGGGAGPRPEAAPRPEPAAPKPFGDESPDFGANNKLFTKDRADAARARLQAKRNRLNAGFDPEGMLDGLSLAGYYIEGGVRKFVDFVRPMLRDLGEEWRSHLPYFYKSVRDYPGFDNHGMDSDPTIDAEFKKMAEAPESEDGVQGPLPGPDDRPGAEDVHGPTPIGETGPTPPGEEHGGAPDAGGSPGEGTEGGGRPPEEHGGAPHGGSDSEGDTGGVPDTGEGPAPGTTGRPPPRPDDDVKGTNLVLEPGEVAEGRGLTAKARDNLAAIELAKQIIAEDRPATREEQVALAKYVGWGGLSRVFPDESTGEFGKGLAAVGARLREVLSPEEYATARDSTRFAHYTAEHVVRSMWDAVHAMGFDGGLVFEPGMGVGHFIGMMPPDIAARTSYQGIEMDHLTATIARLIYPESGVRQGDYRETPMPENHFDLVIGNPPFSSTVIREDPKYRARGFELHDYFFAKSLDSVRPGGLMAFVTSAGTMNKVGTEAREYLAQRAEFVGGVRLNSSAFRKNANTDVTTDILFFKKRPETVPLSRIPEHAAWTETVERTLPDKDGNPTTGQVSRYFSEHPEMVLGTEGFTDKLYEGRYAVQPIPGRDLATDLQAAIERLPKNIMDAPQTPGDRAALDFTSGQKKEGSFYIAPNGRLMVYRQGAGEPVPMRGAGGGGFTVQEADRIRHLIPLRDAMRDVFRHDLAENAEGAAAARVELNKHYDAFVARFGPINKAEFEYRRPTRVQAEGARLEAREEARAAELPWDDGDFDPSTMISKGATTTEISKAREAARERAQKAGKRFDEGTFDPEDMPDVKLERRPNIKPFMLDPESYRMRSIENYNDNTGEASKKRIFRESVITREVEPTLSSAHDGVLWSLNKFGLMDLDAIADKMGKSHDDLIRELGNSVFRVPGTDRTYQSDAEYLSGDVTSKLETARAAMATDPSMERNVKALEDALPRPLPPEDIVMTMGMPWIPVETMNKFVQEHLKLGDVGIIHIPQLGKWELDDRKRGDQSGRVSWGTSRRDALEILSDTLNRTPPKIYDTFRGPPSSRVFNEVATQEATDMYHNMRREFQDWVEGDAERHAEMAKQYNDNLNRTVLRVFNGDYLTTPGISAEWAWRPHQTRVVSRIIQTGSTYMAHAVGAGKTSAMIGAGMEMRRLGLVKKPMYVVPNHMLGQFAKEFYEQYPTARIAVADDDRFITHRRRQFISDAAQDDLDAIIIKHSDFNKIPISREFERGLIQQELDAYRDAISKLNKQRDRITIKKLEDAVDKLRQRLSSARGGKDENLTFEELGADFLFVDEAHMFRKLSFASVQNLKGIDPAGSNRAWDLFVKTRYLDQKNPGRAAVFASGTPITNTMGELYTLSRYLQPRALLTRGLSHFDSWAQMFGDVKIGLEAQPNGQLKPVERFAHLVNTPELYKMVGEIMDVVTPGQLGEYVTRPRIAGGERKLHIAPFTEEQAAYREILNQRMQAIAMRSGPVQKGDDILLSVINDGRHAAIDPRFVMPTRSDPRSKLNAMIDNVFNIWRDTKDTQFYHPRNNYEEPAHRGPATQMIFLNLGVNGRGPTDFSGYTWIKAQLRARGVPASEIADIGDYKTAVAKQTLFNDMNEGKVRILLGSVQKMGTGVNAQRQLIALHNVDPLWYPADDEQRVGRMLRQGNMNPEVQIHDYTTMDTYDKNMWEMMGRKGRFIEQFFRGDPDLRFMEDLGEASAYEQAAAMATSDPRIFRLTEMRQALDTADRRKRAFDRRRYDLNSERDRQVYWHDWYAKQIPGMEADIAQRISTRGDAFRMTVGAAVYDKRKDAAAALAQMQPLTLKLDKNESMQIGTIGGFPLIAERDASDKIYIGFRLRLNNDAELVVHGDIGNENGASGLIESAEARLRGLENRLAERQADIAEARQKYADLTAELAKPFTGQPEIDRLVAEVRALEAEMRAPPAQAPIPAQGWNAPIRTPLGFSGNEPGEPMFALRVPLYSAVERSVGALKQARGTGEQMLAQVLKTPGVRAEEVKAIGLDDWLRGQKNVTREQVADFVRANQIDVHEVIHHHDEAGTAQVNREIAALGLDPNHTSINSLERAGASEDLINRFNSMLFGDADRANPRYDDPRYREAGGKDYHESAITLPVKYENATDAEKARRIANLEQQLAEAQAHDNDGLVDYLWGELQDLQRDATTFSSAHWPYANTVGHVRWSTFIRPDGTRELRIHEVQSDWHQLGRKHGYKTATTPAEIAANSARQNAAEQAAFRLMKSHDNLGFEYPTQALRAILQHADWAERWPDVDKAGRDVLDDFRRQTLEMQKLRDPMAVPDAPFKTSWRSLIMRRMIKFAVDNGYDHVTWLPGEVQNERYPNPDRDPRKMIRAYNEILPADVNKIVRPFGAKVIRTEVGPGVPEALELRRIPAGPNFTPEGWRYFDTKSQSWVSPRFYYEEAAETWLKDHHEPGSRPAYSLEITPALSHAVATEGLPLFARQQRNALPGETPNHEAGQQMADAVNHMLGGKGRVEVVGLDTPGAGLRITMPDGSVRTADALTIGRLIRVAFDGGRTFQHMNHEVIHALRNMGVFTPQEWRLLEAQAKREGWADRYGIRDTYRGASEELILEEAIAHRAGDVAGETPAQAGPLLTRIANKLHDVFARLRNWFQGHGYQTADDILSAVRSGEIGAREPGSGMVQRGSSDMEVNRDVMDMYQPGVPRFAMRPEDEGEPPADRPGHLRKVLEGFNNDVFGSPTEEYSRFEASPERIAGRRDLADRRKLWTAVDMERGVQKLWTQRLTEPDVGPRERARIERMMAKSRARLEVADHMARLAGVDPEAPFPSDTQFAEFMNRDRSGDNEPRLSEAPVGWGTADTATGIPSHEAIQAAADTVAKMLGGNVHVAVVDGGIRLQSYRPGVDTPRFIGGFSLGRLIRVALDQNTIRTLDHEAIHALRGLGVFTEREWATLEAAARKENWIKRYDVQRWGDLPEDKQIEEAIAERFASGPLAPKGSLIERLTARLNNWFARFRSLMDGHGFRSADDVFSKIRSNEIGAREPGSRTEQRGPQTIAESERYARIFHPEVTPRGADDNEPRFALRPGTPTPPTPPPASPLRRVRDFLLDRPSVHQFTEGWLKFAAPMRLGRGEPAERSFAFANQLRKSAAQFGALAGHIRDNFTVPERWKMGLAQAKQSTFEHQLTRDLAAMPAVQRPAYAATARARFDASGEGHAGLSAPARMIVENLSALADQVWQDYRDRGMVHPDAEGWAHFMPRSLVILDPVTGKARYLTKADAILPSRPSPGGGGKMPGAPDIHPFGTNLHVEGPGFRNHEEIEETLRAARAKFGPNVHLVNDILSLVDNLKRSNDAIAGHDLVAAIKTYGRATGAFDNEQPGFTIAGNPAMWRWQPKLVDDGTGTRVIATTPDGKNIFEKVPIYLPEQFRGPLEAVLRGPRGGIMKAFMALKSVSTHMVMLSPLTHLNVELSRALPLRANKRFVVFQLAAGRRARMSDDPNVRAQIDQLMDHGMAPISGGFRGDPTSLLDEAHYTPPFGALGRAVVTARDAMASGLGKVPGTAGEILEKLIRRPIQTLLWNRVLDLQIAIGLNVAQDRINAGWDPTAAYTAGAHIANRYAGALPPEGMSQLANTLEHVLLFSRSYTGGNIGILKDTFTGAPQHVIDHVGYTLGPEARAAFEEWMKKKARTTFVMDMVMYWGLGALLQQAAYSIFAGNQPNEGFVDGYIRRFNSALNYVEEHPLRSAILPLSIPQFMTDLMPMADNEEGKANRIRMGQLPHSLQWLYARPPTGKVGEDIFGWFLDPSDTLQRKQSTFARGLVEAITGRDSLGRDIMRPGEGQKLENFWRATAHFLQAQFPTDPFPAAWTALGGPGASLLNIPPPSEKDVALARAQTFGTATGLLQFSRGHPLGPLAQDESTKERQQRFDATEAMPQVQRLAAAGHTEEAAEILVKTGMDRRQANKMVNRLDPRNMPEDVPTLPAWVTRRANKRGDPVQLDRREVLKQSYGLQ